MLTESAGITSQDILSLGYDALLRYLMPRSDKPHQYAKAICQSIYGQLNTNIAAIEGVPRDLGDLLATTLTLHTPELLTSIQDNTGRTRKDLIALADGSQVEIVLLRYRQRFSLCISSQVGCACNCVFCATGQMGFIRQLSPGEIISQVHHAQRVLAEQDSRADNIVLMGMGEPFLNYDAVIEALHILVDARMFNFAPRHITVSTAGIAPRIVDFARDAPPVKLAISLHAATDDLRNTLMPINQRYPLAELFAAVRAYTTETHRRVMFEWTMIAGVNDTPEQAHALAAWLKGIPAHINFILLNNTGAYRGQPATTAQVDAFGHILDRYNIPHTLRQNRGNTIISGCGQLRSREINQAKPQHIIGDEQ